MKTLSRTFVACLAAGWVLAAFAHGVAPRADDLAEARPPAVEQAVEQGSLAGDLTVELLQQRTSHARTKAAGKDHALSTLVEIARDRRDTLVDLLDTNPAEVLRVALPASARASLPAEVQPFLEQDADETGEIEVLHVDHVDAADDYYLRFLNTARGRIELHFAGTAPDLATGAKARVRGLRLGSAIVVAGRADVTTEKALAVAPNTKGVQRTLAILVNFSNAPSQQPYSVATVGNVLFGTTSNFDYEVSYQQTTLSGTVAGWFTIAATSSTCDVNAISTQAKAAATGAGYVLSDYARLVYIFPSNACTWWGVGTVGGQPSQAWIHTRWGLSVNILAHEMGHNFGLFHSHSLDCGSSAVAAYGCAASEYGDVFDMMGNSVGGHFNAFQKERLGWLDDGVSPPIVTVPAQTGTASYDIAPLAGARDDRPRALKVPRASACGANDEWFYVEARQATGFDAFLSGNYNVTHGVLVRKVAEGNADSSFLLDMTPSTSAWSDAALVAGYAFTDPQTGLKIKTVSAGSGGARVDVTFPAAACTRAAPAVTVTPGGTVWTPAGSSVAYTVQAQNRDSCGCAATPFDIAATVPSGWGATNARTASIAAGGTTAASILVTTPAGAAAAFYPVTLTATSVAAPTLSASAPATVAIESSGAEPPPAEPTTEPTAPPVVPALAVVPSTDKPAYPIPTSGKTNVAITSAATKNGAPLAYTTATVEVRDPAGSIRRFKGQTSATGLVTFTYSISKRGARAGGYTVTSRVTSGTLSATGSTAFTVN
ncbi:hypothetical protein BURK1_02884 [Burkholderiales bacterium]|nr:hypothetical protein BURK1_02884 [Burkholderiales bacterium]